MVHVRLIYHEPLTLPDGRIYTALCGREREDGIWEGDQINLADLEYWATGITPVYLKGVLERTVTICMPAKRRDISLTA